MDGSSSETGAAPAVDNDVWHVWSQIEPATNVASGSGGWHTELQHFGGRACPVKSLNLEGHILMEELGSIPLIVGGLLLLLILGSNIYFYVWYRKYKRVAQALPDPRAIEQAPPETVDKKRAALKSRLLDDWSKLPDHELAMTRHALWMAMLLEAASDGCIDHREMRFVADLFGDLGGEKIDFRPVIKAAELVDSDKKSALSEISKAKKVSNASKEQILAGAFMVSISDHSLSEVETNCLRDIADALAINKRDRKAILEGITERFGI